MFDSVFSKRAKPVVTPLSALRPFLSALIGPDTMVAVTVYGAARTLLVERLPGAGVEALDPSGRDGMVLWVWSSAEMDSSLPPSATMRGPDVIGSAQATRICLLDQPTDPAAFSGGPFRTCLMNVTAMTPASLERKRVYTAGKLVAAAQAAGMAS